MNDLNARLQTMNYSLIAVVPEGLAEEAELFVVMAVNTRSLSPERRFATWEYGRGNLFTGHYDLTFHEAREDFVKRAKLSDVKTVVT